MADEEWDTLVIGAGVLGSATAYHLQRTDPDLRVLLLDRHPRPQLGPLLHAAALAEDGSGLDDGVGREGASVACVLEDAGRGVYYCEVAHGLSSLENGGGHPGPEDGRR